MRTESAIQSALWDGMRDTYRPILPNYTPPNWWECDLFAVSKTSSFWYEFEIKLTTADFKKDMFKSDRVYRNREWVTLLKHDLLKAKSEAGPSRFYYLLTPKVAERVEIPDYAGLKVIKETNGRVWLEDVKQAPLLHRARVAPEIVAKVYEACYWRFWNQRRNMNKEVQRQLTRTQNATDE